MALGATTYKTPNAINQIDSDFTGKEGCGVYLIDQGKVGIATTRSTIPYGVVVVGGQSADGTYAGPIGGSAIEFVDQLGCVVQVTVSPNSAIYAGDFVVIDNAEANGTFTSVANQGALISDWIWGLALTNANPDEQCLMRFQPFAYFSTYTPPSP